MSIDWRVLGLKRNKKKLSIHTNFTDAITALDLLDCGVILPPDDISERVILELIRMKDFSKEERILAVDILQGCS